MTAEPIVMPERLTSPPSWRLRWQDAPLVLMYHSVSEQHEDPYALAVSPGRFAAQMAWLARRGLRGVAVSELLATPAQRRRGLVGLTFDDGYVDVLEQALPVLQRHGFGATAFIVSGRLGGTNDWDGDPVWPLLDADGVRALARAGLEIGSHSVTHPRLAGCAPDRLTYEVRDSRAALEALLGVPVRGFAYPHGSMDARARAAVRRAGYAYACAVSTPWSALEDAALPRVYVGGRDTGGRLAVKRRVHRLYSPLRGGVR